MSLIRNFQSETIHFRFKASKISRSKWNGASLLDPVTQTNHSSQEEDRKEPPFGRTGTPWTVAFDSLSKIHQNVLAERKGSLLWELTVLKKSSMALIKTLMALINPQFTLKFFFSESDPLNQLTLSPPPPPPSPLPAKWSPLPSSTGNKRCLNLSNSKIKNSQVSIIRNRKLYSSDRNV